jgi:hypothetical protein
VKKLLWDLGSLVLRAQAIIEALAKYESEKADTFALIRIPKQDVCGGSTIKSVSAGWEHILFVDGS